MSEALHPWSGINTAVRRADGAERTGLPLERAMAASFLPD